MKDLLHRLEERLRTSRGVRVAFPPHAHPPYRATPVDICEYYFDHDMVDPITPVAGFLVPEGHLFYLDSVVIAGNIFQSPHFWDWGNVQLKLFRNNVEAHNFSTGVSGLVRADQGTGQIYEASPMLYLANDISDIFIPPTVDNLDAGDDALMRVRSGHSPVYGLEYEGQGSKVVYRPGDRVEIRYEVRRPGATLPGGGAANLMHLARLSVATGSATGNILGLGNIGIPAGPDDDPSTDDAGFYAVGPLTPQALGAQALLSDGDYTTSAGLAAMNLWVGGESYGVQVGGAVDNDCLFLKNQAMLFLSRRSSQAEIDNVTWQVAASDDNLNWHEMQLDRVRYREIPAFSLYWIEFDFTQDNANINPCSDVRGFPLSSEDFVYVKVRADTVNGAGIGANLNVTEMSVGFRVVHRLAARLIGWMWQPEYDVISAGGARVG